MAEALDLFRTKLAEFETLIQKEHDLEMAPIREALQKLGKELRKTPDLCYMLEDSELGTITRGSMITTGVKAELEAKKKKAPRKKAATKTSVKDKPMEIIDPDAVLF